MSICHLTSLVLTQVARSFTTPQCERWDAKMMWWWLWFSDWWVCWPSNPHRLRHASKQRNRETWEHVCRPQPLLKRWDWVNAGDWGMWGKLPTRHKSLEPVLPFSHLGSSDMSISQFHWLTQWLMDHTHTSTTVFYLWMVCNTSYLIPLWRVSINQVQCHWIICKQGGRNVVGP